MKSLVISSLILLSTSLPVLGENLTNKHWFITKAYQNDIGETCLEMDAGQSLMFEFESNHEVEFNLHYHKGKKVSYPIKSHKTSAIKQTFKAPMKQTYCLMWKGLNDEPSKIKVKYKILPADWEAKQKNSELTPVLSPAPEYPLQAIKHNIEGYVTFLMDIEPSGKPTNIRVFDEKPKGVFTRVATRAISKWVFKPKIINKEPVKQKDTTFTMSFVLEPKE